MTTTQVHLNGKETRFVNIYKAIKGLKNKDAAIRGIIRELENAFEKNGVLERQLGAHRTTDGAEDG